MKQVITKSVSLCDRRMKIDAWDVLQRELEPAMRAGDHEFISVSADDVISRNKRAFLSAE
ncbi:hypothetical protein [Agrobacterium sp.]|uniref:hypothetical protein n=1 Tax=Agrobacterium sp. TaxID=361 RepID=UPI0028A7353B|nr:hypothetical protein [Agrobacterium sp.]